MSEKEKENIKILSDVIPKLGAAGQSYILGMAEGMAIAKQLSETKQENK